LATFPNSYSLPATAPQSSLSGHAAAVRGASWSSAQRSSPLAELRQAVQEEDWDRNYCEGLTRIHMRAEWSAGPERCSLLQWLVSVNQAHRVLEIGSFCGSTALALAEALPAQGEVHALELDRFVVSFGQRFWMRSRHGHKIRHSVGPALESLRLLAAEASEGVVRPFDLVVVDADKENMSKYFDLLWKSPGILSEGAVVCVDMTPFKGQPPVRYVKYGFPHRWECSSGEQEINALRDAVMSSPEFEAHAFGGLLIVQRARGQH